ncbi:xanthine dehydrogenase family protein subunit M [Nocardioides oleivorans]|uniref:Xanthine dehydrogenase family protein subunit M n=1 Tax=Nocardioides oleivorans TaxID=273676 RepID=A0A4Q2RTT7_9ACTN|nr:FAD binding domain-containing protein [Nocardioides oleivorans]RYB92036.1 xanthine dehydrogenase family protein subunit M [Nocardioides oleivorans]
MHPFTYTRVDDVDAASAAVTTDAVSRAVQQPDDTVFIAGGTTQLDLMRDGVWSPGTVVDISRLPLAEVTVDGDTLVVGAAVTMAELARHEAVAGVPVLRDSLLLAASPQLRAMATIGGNVLQRTRCRYFRDPEVTQCNKRRPGSGCAAIEGTARTHAVLGVDAGCIAVHASDLAVALVALDARVRLHGPDGDRTIPVAELHVRADDDPARDNVLRPGELVTHLEVPLPDARSGYLKVRDRASYEFALTSAAVVARLEDGVLAHVAVGLGGVGSVPWRASRAEEVLRGRVASLALFEEAAAAELADAFTVPGTAFKPELARRTLVRQLRDVTGVTA